MGSISHLYKPSTLKVGQKVLKGQIVGGAGTTGDSTGVHLHFEVIKDQPFPLKSGYETYNPREFDFSASDTGGAGGASTGMGAACGMGEGGADAGESGTIAPRIDPLALDLDGDGIETRGADGKIVFDHNGDGLKTGTGWVHSDDGLLVLDRNSNGTIDNGGELFGVDTTKSDGKKASDGFDALSDLDSNDDGVFDAKDTRFKDVRVWRDLNQDGVSQGKELSTLAANNIRSISLSKTSKTTNLGNGNTQTATATFTRTDDTTGTAANLGLASNTFYRRFTNRVTLTDKAKKLPEASGSGSVRDLREAISRYSTLNEYRLPPGSGYARFIAGAKHT